MIKTTNITVELDRMQVVPKTVMSHEVDILKVMYGDKVEVIGDGEPVDRKIDLDAEKARLQALYQPFDRKGETINPCTVAYGPEMRDLKIETVKKRTAPSATTTAAPAN